MNQPGRPSVYQQLVGSSRTDAADQLARSKKRRKAKRQRMESPFKNEAFELVDGIVNINQEIIESQAPTLAPEGAHQAQAVMSMLEGVDKQDLTEELLKMNEDADADAMMSDQAAKKKKRRKRNKNKRNKKAGAQDNEGLDDEEQEMDSGIQSTQDGRASQRLNQSSSLMNTTAVQNLQVIVDQDSQDLGEVEHTRGKPDSSPALGHSGMVCLTKLSDEEFEN